MGLGSLRGLTDFTRQAFSCTLGGGDPARAVSLASDALRGILGPVLLGAAAGALAVGLVQSGGLFAPRAIGVKPERGPSLVRWLLALALGGLGLATLRNALPLVAHATSQEEVAAALGQAARRFFSRAVILFAMAGLGDFVWRRLRLERTLRMTRAEHEAERRRDEANPHIAAELRRRHRN